MGFSFSVTGDHKKTTRIVLKSHSMNVALADKTKIDTEYGLPTRSLIEVSGGTGIGKSTFVTDLASQTSQGLGNVPIRYLDLEGQSENTIYNTLENSDFGSEFQWVTSKKKTEESYSIESLVNQLEDGLWEEPAHIGVLDSIAAFTTVAEREGDIGDANMGRRAFSMAQFCRRVNYAFTRIDTPSCIFMLNHQYEKVGAIGMAKQITSPGGEVKQNLAKLRLRMSIPWVDYISGGDGKGEGKWYEDPKNKLGCYAWILEGLVDKNREGAKARKFQVFVYGGWGVHVGMSALIDCLASGLATVKTGGKVMMDGQDYGAINKIVATKRDDKEFFVDFQNALRVQTVAPEVDDE